MTRRFKTFAAVFMVTALLLSALAGTASAADGVIFAGNFNGPQGILVAPDGNVWVVDAGTGGEQQMEMTNPETGEKAIVTMGNTSRVVKIDEFGTQTEAARLPSIAFGMEASGGSRLALLNGVLYATSGGWTPEQGDTAAPLTAAVVKVDGGQATEVAQTWPLEKAQNPDGTLVDTHPYGLTAGPDGNLWVADAGGNTLLKVNPADGATSVAAVFRTGLPSPMPNPARGNKNEADPVPTAVEVGADGGVYVSFLSGFPFTPGSAKVVKVAANGTYSDYATGLTMLTDLRLAPDGNLYATSFGQFGEQGPTPGSGAILRIKPGTASETIMTGLSFPTSLDFNAAGDAYVTLNGVGAPGSGLVMLYKGLAAPAAGAPAVAPAAVAAPAASAPVAAPAAAMDTAAAPPPATLPTTGGGPDLWAPAILLAAMAGLFVARRVAQMRPNC
jgi:sugar lactone lactonase YvrE